MKLEFDTITWRNFLSTGKVPTTINLRKSSDTLIVGENGAGKSTLIDAITFALYNKPFRDIGKPELVNSINGKDCLIELTLESGGVPYRIVRGIKPNIFEIYQNGNLVKQDAAIKDYQKWLETHVLKMNFKAFSQIVVLGSDSYIPFMRLKSSRRREVIEEILDIEIFSSMNSVLKRKLQQNRELLETNRMTSTVLQERFETLKKHNNTIKSGKDEIRKSYLLEIDDSETYIKLQQNEIEIVNSDLQERKKNTSNVDVLRDKLNELTRLHSSVSTKRQQAEKMSNFMKTRDDCPTCTQEINPSHKKEVIDKNDTITHECDIGIQQLDEKISKAKLKIREGEKALSEIRKLEQEIDAAKVRIESKRSYQNKLRKLLANMDKETESTPDETKLIDVEAELENSKAERTKLIEEKKYLDFSQTLLKDDGIKTREILRYLPLINTQINKHLQAMDCYVNFTLDENFEEIIKSRHRDKFTYNSFSAGERLRIDLALLFTWREVAAKKNSVHTNLLIMDEVFDSSLDSQGTEEFLKIIKTLGHNTNIFVISHRNEFLYDKFRSIIKFQKTNNFSEMEK